MADYTALFDACALYPFTLRYDIEAQHPDDFVISQFDLNVEKVVASFKRQRANLRNPPLGVDEFLESLARSEMVQTVDRLSSWRELI